METKNVRNVGNKRNQGSNKAILNKEGATAKLSGLSIRGRGRAPLAEISVNNRIPSTNKEGVTTKSKLGVSKILSANLKNISRYKNISKLHFISILKSKYFFLGTISSLPR